MVEQRLRGWREATGHISMCRTSDKDVARVLGARWDPAVKRCWYDPRPPTPALRRWAARADVPELLPGEDRAFGSGLFVDLVPASCWFTNVRTCVSARDWERLRRTILRRAAHACEIGGATEDRSAGQRLEAHERWTYDEDAGVQALRRAPVSNPGVWHDTACYTNWSCTAVDGVAGAVERVAVVAGRCTCVRLPAAL